MRFILRSVWYFLFYYRLFCDSSLRIEEHVFPPFFVKDTLSNKYTTYLLRDGSGFLWMDTHLGLS